MNELRQDLASGDWVILAPGRASRPDMLKKKNEVRKPSPKSTCPFENLEKTGNWPPLALYPENKKNWGIAVIQNKYPALVHMEGCSVAFHNGLYLAKTAVGSHELVITRDHNKSFVALSAAQALELFHAFQDRHRAAAKDYCLVYVTTFFNGGVSVGGSVWHPHYQIVGLPVVPPHAVHSLRGEEAYFKKNHRCVRCDIIKEEKKQGKRIVAENKFAIAFAPYASKRPFEVSILPKRHIPHFAKTPAPVLAGMAEVLQTVLKQMKQRVSDPDLNFFIHDAPFDKKNYSYHHWHIEVLPNISRLGGLEFSTGVYINVVDPDMAAAVLTGKKV